MSGIIARSSTPSKPMNSVITDGFSRQAKISQKGEMLVASCIDDVDVNFQYIVRTKETVSTTTGTGTVTHPGASGAYAQLSAGTGVGKAQLLSKAPIRYRGGHESYCELSWIFRTPEDNLEQWCGFLNDNDRWCVGYRGQNFGALFREGGNDTFIPSTSFNYDKLDGTGPSGYTINPQTINVYRLAFVWHGGLPLTLEISIRQRWYPVHFLDFANVITETHLENPHLPIGGIVERTSGTGTAEDARTGSWRGGSLSGMSDEQTDDWVTFTVLDRTLVSAARTNVMTLVNPTTWQGKTNHIVYRVGLVTFINQGNKTVGVYGTKGATLTGATTSAFIDETNFALQYRTGGTLTGGSREPATILRANGKETIDERNNGVLIFPGESLTVDVDPGGAINGTFSAVLRLIHES